MNAQQIRTYIQIRACTAVQSLSSNSCECSLHSPIRKWVGRTRLGDEGKWCVSGGGGEEKRVGGGRITRGGGGGGEWSVKDMAGG